MLSRLIKRFVSTVINMSARTLFLFALLLVSPQKGAEAAISVGPSGSGTITFDTQPNASDWSTRTWTGASGDITSLAALDAAVQTNSASIINEQLAATTGSPPAATTNAQWSSDGHFLITRPTGVACQAIMATLRNDTGGNVSSLPIGYTLTVVAPVTEEIRGHLVYYSLTGNPNSWQQVAGISGDDVSGSKSAVLDLSATPWLAGSSLYLLWVDDNGSGTPDTALELDNAAFGPLIPVSITQQPSNTTILQCRSATLSVSASGSPPISYQWFRNGNPIPNATAATFSIANAQPSDAGNYFCRVTNPVGSVDSRVATLTISPDTAPPALLNALLLRGRTNLVISFSEPLDPFANLDTFKYVVYSLCGNNPPANIHEAVVTNQTNVFLNFEEPLSTGRYALDVSDIFDACAFNSLSHATITVCEETVLVGIDAAQIWRYDQSGNDLGMAWRLPAYDDSSWLSGMALFDAKRPTNRVSVSGEIVRTQLSLTNGTGTNNVTYYFRTHFNLASTQAACSLRLRTFVDDGAVFYMNGTEVFRLGVPSGQTFSTFANRTVGDAAYEGPFDINPASLVTGDNLLAVELHQAALTSTDITFGMELTAGLYPACPQTECLALACPTNIVTECQTPAGTRVSFNLTATNRCSTNLTIACMPPGNTFFPLGTTTVDCTASGDGQSLGCSFTVTVVDSRPPQIFCPEDIVAVTTNAQSARVSFNVTVLDNCSTNLHAVCQPASNSLFPVGVTRVTCYVAEFPTNSCSLMVTVISQPCQQTAKGRDFWLTYPGNHAPNKTVDPILCIVGMPNTGGQVEIPGLSFSTTFSIPASMAASVHLPAAAHLKDVSDAVRANGVHVTASNDVSVVAISQLDYTTEAFLVFPTAVIGKSYMVLAYGDVHTNAQVNGSEFALVASEDATSVTITPSVSTGSRIANMAYTIALNRGETYQLQTAEAVPKDLTGTRILSSGRIAVIAGHKCAFVPTNDSLFCNFLGEMLPPTQAWGNNFALFPLATRSNFVFRCLALDPNTTVRTNSVLMPLLGAGSFHQRKVSGPLHIASDGPILVAQFSTSSSDDDVEPADPFMVLVPPTSRFLTNCMICTPTNYFETNYLNIVAPDNPGRTILVDGSAIPPGDFTTIGVSGYSGARVQLTGRPAHTLSGNVPFGATVYGYSKQFDAYGYVAGLALPGTTPPMVTCPTNLDIVANQNCRATVPAVMVGVSEHCSPLTFEQRPAPGTAVGPGVYPVTNIVSDIYSNVIRCVTTLRVRSTNAPTLVCPTNLSVGCVDSNGANVAFSVTAQPGCDTNLTVICAPPSGSVFPPGVSTVRCTAQDGSDNTASCSFTVTVRDTLPPRITCPSDIATEANRADGAVVNFTAAVFDSCGTIANLTCSPPSGTLFPLGTHGVICTGQLVSCTFQVQVFTKLQANVSGASFVLRWTGTNVALEASATLTQGGWSEIIGATSPYPVLPTGSAKFFRLHQK